MKVLLIVFCILLIHRPGISQTNIFPSSGNVGIGTLTPAYPLDAPGSARLGFTVLTGSNSPLTNSSISYPATGMHNIFGVDGSWSSKYFGMKTDGTFISMGGNVGIGTTDPSALLHVFKPGNNTILKIGNSGTFDQYIHFNSDSDWSLGIDNSNSNALTFSNYSSPGTNDRMTITSTGNIGMGTNNPSNKLTLRSPALGSSNDVGIDFSTVNGSYSPVYGRIALGVNTASESNGSGYLGFSTLNADVLAEHMRIAANGNIGIGTSTPDSKLTVAGKIHSQEVKATTTAGADFVFEEDYKLRTLLETENFIKNNKHLPEIASAEYMKKNGIQLGEMNIKLLQKIEELTLYLIDLNKKFDVQKSEVERLIGVLNTITQSK